MKREASSQARSFLKRVLFQKDERHRKMILAAPTFWVHSTDVSVLSTPQEFYSELLAQSHSATNRVSLASLYLGTGEMERSLLESLADNYRRKKDLKVRVVLDKNRGTRIERRPASHGGQSSATLFQSTVGSITTDALPDERSDTSEFRLGLFKMPLRQDDWFARFILPRLPPRYNELLTTFHLKAYAFDDTLIMTGANLSGDYFTTRQDRYWVIRDAPLAALYHDMIDILCDAAQNIDDSTGEEERGSERGGESRSSRSSNSNSNSNSMSIPSNHDRTTDHAEIKYKSMKAKLEHLMRPTLIEDWRQDRTDPPSSSSSVTSSISQAGWTCIQPTIQCAALGMRHDEMMTKNLLAKLDDIANDEIENFEKTKTKTKTKIKTKTAYVSTGYLNFHDHFIRLLLNMKTNVTVLAASPEANGFFNAAGISGSLPMAYSLIGHRLLREARAKEVGTFQMCEYHRSGWTYHAKGLWFTKRFTEKFNTTLTPPLLVSRSDNRSMDNMSVDSTLADNMSAGVDASFDRGGVNEVMSTTTSSFGGLTLVGSPNFGYRSVERDFESSLLIVTEDKHLQLKMERELNDLMSHVSEVDLSEFQKAERKLVGLFSWKNGWWISPASRIVRNLM